MVYESGSLDVTSSSQTIDLKSLKRFVIVENSESPAIFIKLSETRSEATINDRKVAGFGKLRAKGKIRYISVICNANETSTMDYTTVD
tara:strand:- start:348 stop:611 length:264 start_codon:yes stop_codon:yes gene_type:complete